MKRELNLVVQLKTENMQNEKPILFSSLMVQAILEGRKTMTRRICKRQPLDWQVYTNYKDGTFNINGPDYDSADIKCPYGQPGDILWVRETFYAFGHWIEVINKKGKPGLEFVDETLIHGHSYKYFDNPPEKIQRKRIMGSCAWYKRPSIHMPKAACRIKLLVKSVRVERLQNITEQDAIAEGIERCGNHGFKNYLSDIAMLCLHPATRSFESLWQSINGPDSWDANPWVWVVEFERIKE